MLGLLLLYWIGKYYYKLSEKYEKSKWGYTVLGIATYYIGTFVFAFIIVIIGEVSSSGFINNINETLLSLLSLPFGLLSCYLLYKYLKKDWGKNSFSVDSAIEEIGKEVE